MNLVMEFSIALTKCLNFIVQNREKVIVTKGFEDLSKHPALLMEVAKGFAGGSM